MHVLPRSRRGRITAGVLLIALLVAVWVRRDEIAFLAKLAVPGPAYDGAADRTSEPAPAGDAVALPATVDAAGPTGADPTLRIGDGIALSDPAAIADAPGPGPVLVATLGGQVHVVDLVAGTTDVVLDISARISTGGERGLLGMAIDPSTDRLYLDFTDDAGDTEIRSWALDAHGLPIDGDGILHLEVGQPFENHNGGNLVIGPDGALWIGTGDGGGAGDAGEVAQDDRSLLGKMLRIVPNPEGGARAPTTNPGWERSEIWGIGLRNPWRYSFDRETGRLWIADVGQNTIEEVSVVDGDLDRPNFGWDTVEGANDYEGQAQPEFTAPVVAYDHDEGCSIAGGFVYRGTANLSLYGWYLFSDYCTGFIRAVPADDPTASPTELATGLGNVIGFGELDTGELLVLTKEGLRPILPA